MEVRGVIRFLQAKGKNPTEIHRELIAVYGKHVMSRKQVSVWCSAFTEGRTNLQDEPRVGRPRSSTTEDNIAHVDALIQDNKQHKLRDMAAELDIPKSVVHEIVHEKLGYQKVSSHWVPKQLIEENKFKCSSWYTWDVLLYPLHTSNLAPG